MPCHFMTSKMISAPNIAKALGYGNSPAFILSSAILALILLFYIYTVGSYFHIGVSPLENRVNYHESFSIYITNKYFDHLIIAAGTVLWIALSLIGKARIVASTIYGIMTIAAISAKIGTVLDTVALISIPVVISFLIYNRLTTKKILHSSNLTITYLTIICFALGIISSVISLAPLFSITQKSIPISDYAYEIFVL